MQTAEKRPTGHWYHVITIASAGTLACVPFFHAASELKRRDLTARGMVYAGLAMVAMFLMQRSPVDADGSPSGIVSDLTVIAMIVLVIAASLEQRQLRPLVYGRAVTQLAEVPVGHLSSVEWVEHARRLREEARRLSRDDPLMARELRIGRPDLARRYDDGGLVDLNNAPAQVIAETCDVATEVAERIAHARASVGEFHSVEEAIVYADVQGGAVDLIRDRALVLPAVPGHRR